MTRADFASRISNGAAGDGNTIVDIDTSKTEGNTIVIPAVDIAVGNWASGKSNTIASMTRADFASRISNGAAGNGNTISAKVAAGDGAISVFNFIFIFIWGHLFLATSRAPIREFFVIEKL